MSRDADEAFRRRQTVGLLYELIEKVQNEEWILTGESMSYVEIDGHCYPTDVHELQFRKVYKTP